MDLTSSPMGRSGKGKLICRIAPREHIVMTKNAFFFDTSILSAFAMPFTLKKGFKSLVWLKIEGRYCGISALAPGYGLVFSKKIRFHLSAVRLGRRPSQNAHATGKVA